MAICLILIQFVNNNEKKEENNKYGYVRDLESGS